MPMKYRILSAMMACWILFSSIGLSIDAHFCNGILFSVGVNTAALVCAGFNDAASVEGTLHKPSCCNQQAAYCQKGVDGMADSSPNILPIQMFLAIEFVKYHELTFEDVNDLSTDDSPPERSRDIGLLCAVFRI